MKKTILAAALFAATNAHADALGSAFDSPFDSVFGEGHIPDGIEYGTPRSATWQFRYPNSKFTAGIHGATHETSLQACAQINDAKFGASNVRGDGHCPPEDRACDLQNQDILLDIAKMGDGIPCYAYVNGWKFSGGYAYLKQTPDTECQQVSDQLPISMELKHPGDIAFIMIDYDNDLEWDSLHQLGDSHTVNAQTVTEVLSRSDLTGDRADWKIFTMHPGARDTYSFVEAKTGCAVFGAVDSKTCTVANPNHHAGMTQVVNPFQAQQRCRANADNTDYHPNQHEYWACVGGQATSHFICKGQNWTSGFWMNVLHEAD